MKRFTIHAGIALALGLGSMLALLWLLGGSQVVRAADLTVCLAGPPICGYSTVQAAVDAASDGDVIKVAAGTYSDVQGRPAPAGYDGPSIITQVVYISKTVTLRGGYTTAFTDPPDPEANPTTLDAQEQGRVLFIAGEIGSTIEGLRITNGDATGLGGSLLWEGEIVDAGGGVYVTSATATLSDNRVFSNTVTSVDSVGGGLYIYNADATLSGSIISDNTAFWGGGGLYLKECDATLSGNTISGNTTVRGGGGLSLSGGSATLSDNTISGNTGSDGGGLYMHNADATLSDNTISDNSGGCGGGLYIWDAAATISGNTVTSNTAGYGGGLYGGGTLIGNVFSGNTASLDGGGLYGGGTLIGNVFSGNTAEGGGGGLAAEYATIIGNTIIFNTAEVGGGLFLDGWPSGGGVTLINNLVADNRANTAGSGLYVEASSARLLHTTIARNSGGDGSGIYVTASWDSLPVIYSTAALTNTILVSHTVGIYVDADNTATLEATLWGDGAWANETDWDGDGDIITGARNFWGGPAFIDPDTGDYHIAVNSAAVDAGVDAGVDRDIDGDPRPQGGGYDLGADETGLIVSKQTDPDPVQTGARLAYTIRVTNTSNVDLHATVTDVLPNQVMPTGMLTWTPTITAPGGVWMQTVPVTVEMGYTGLLTNVVQVSTAEGATGVYTETSTVEKRYIYLPVVLRQYP